MQNGEQFDVRVHGKNGGGGKIEVDPYDEFLNKQDEEDIKALQARRDQLSQEYRTGETSETEEGQNKLREIDSIDQQIAQIRASGAQRMSKYSRWGTNSTSQNSAQTDYSNFKAGNTGNIGFDAAGGRGYVTGRYGDDRGDHSHKGIDIGGLGEGAPLGVPAVQGVNFTISDVGSSEKGGNYLSMSGTSANGTRVDVIYRHLQDGSTRVKKGQAVGGNDVVAAVGNTGSSSSGAHLHIETKINGQHVNPRNFYKEFEKAENKAGVKANVNSKAGNPNAYNAFTTPYGTNQGNQQTVNVPTTQAPQAPAVQTTPSSADELRAWKVMGQYPEMPSNLTEQFTQAVVDGANLSAIDTILNSGNTQQSGQAVQAQIQIPSGLVFNPQVDNRDNLVRYDEFSKLYEMAEAGRLKNVSINNAQDLINIMLRQGKKVYINR